MKKKTLHLLVLAIAVLVSGVQSALAKDYYRLGARAEMGNLHNGDTVMFRNATCDYGSTSYTTAGKDMWLNGNSSRTGLWNSGTVMKTDYVDPESTFSTDYVFVLESAGNDPVKDKPMFLLKCLSTNKYVSATMYDDGHYDIVPTDTKSSATPFMADSAKFYCRYYLTGPSSMVFSTTQIDDTTVCLIHNEMSSSNNYTSYRFGPFWNYGATYYGVATDVVVWNIYYANLDRSGETLLYGLIEQINEESVSFMIGDNPGNFTESALNELSEKLDEASTLLSEEHTDAEFKAEYESLLSTYDNAKAQRIPISDGYYNIVSAYPEFLTSQDVEKAMSANADKALLWKTYDTKDPAQLFEIKKLDDGNYSIYHVSTNLYINTSDTAAQGAEVKLSASQTTEQTFTMLGVTSQWNIANTACPIAYNIKGYSNGTGTDGVIITWDDVANSPSAWYLRKVTDTALIDSLVNAGTQDVIKEALERRIATAVETLKKPIDHEKYVTDASQFSTNNSSAGDYSSFEHLIDGNTHYYYNFHSIWTSKMDDATITESGWKTYLDDWAAENDQRIAIGIGYHNLQVKFNNPVDKFFFQYIGRTGTTYVDSPNDIEVYVTNEDSLGANPDQANIGQWTKVTELTEGFPGAVQGAVYTSPVLNLSNTYKYVRFVIKGTALMNNATNRSFKAPSITGVTWNVGEFQVYNPDTLSTSEYYTVPGMKDACDNLASIISELENDIANKTAKFSDTARISEAIAKVESLYIDRASLKEQLNEAVSRANSVYSKVFDTSTPLINRASQFKTNSSQAIDESYLENLIDNNTNTAFHSRWTDLMKSDTLTEEEWRTSLAEFASSPGNIAVGIGYHNIQMKFDNPVDSFYFHYIGRNSSTYCDSPSDILISATNDPELGEDPDEANESDWTEITEITEGLTAGGLGEYTSPYINLGASYKYVRFTIKNTSTAYFKEGDGTLNRLFAQPSLTGITWNLSELQLYTQLDSAQLQYNTDKEFKDAVDAMKALADKDADIPAYELTDSTLAAALNAQIDKVNSMIVDQSAAPQVFALYDQIAQKAEAGTDMGYISSEEAINNYKAAVNAAHEAYNSSNKGAEALNTAKTSLAAAYAALAENANKIDNSIWYNFVQNNSETDYTEQPAHLSYANTGEPVYFGKYSEENSVLNDPYSIWRFVPVQGKTDEYYIQLLVNGQYLGGYNGNGHANPPIISHEPAAYKVMYYGNGTYRLSQDTLDDVTNSLVGSMADGIVENGINFNDESGAWTLNPVVDETLLYSSLTDNSIQIFTFPYATKGDNSVTANNGDAGFKTYAIKGVKTEGESSKLELKEQSDFEAGEPMILIINDYEDPEATHDIVTFSMPLPEDVVDSATTSNGLVGTLPGVTFKLNGKGYIKNNKLYTSSAYSTTAIDALSGYIDLTQIVNEEGDADLEIDATGFVTGEANTVLSDAAKNGKVNVYTIDGVLVKKNVSAGTATQGLRKGIYIVGKKKMIVK